MYRCVKLRGYILPVFIPFFPTPSGVFMKLCVSKLLFSTTLFIPFILFIQRSDFFIFSFHHNIANTLYTLYANYHCWIITCFLYTYEWLIMWIYHRKKARERPAWLKKVGNIAKHLPKRPYLCMRDGTISRIQFHYTTQNIKLWKSY